MVVLTMYLYCFCSLVSLPLSIVIAKLAVQGQIYLALFFLNLSLEIIELYPSNYMIAGNPGIDFFLEYHSKILIDFNEHDT